MRKFHEPQGPAKIESIDDLDLPPHDTEASEEALPYDFYEKTHFTPLSESTVQGLFAKLRRNSRARNRVAGGKCSIRRRYIQGYLRSQGIVSGSLYIQCPSLRGHLRLKDQVSGRRYTFSNYHDTNIVAMETGGYDVMDVQFESGPVSLSGYLAIVEASQKLKPLRNRSTHDRGYCYWSIR